MLAEDIEAQQTLIENDTQPCGVIPTHLWCHSRHLRAMAMVLGLPVIIQYMPTPLPGDILTPGPRVFYSYHQRRTPNTCAPACRDQLSSTAQLNSCLRTIALPHVNARPIMIMLNARGIMDNSGM